MFYQSSKYNDNSPELAFDGDVTTCSATGFTKGSWWKVDLGEDVAVKGVHLTGEGQKERPFLMGTVIHEI